MRQIIPVTLLCLASTAQAQAQEPAPQPNCAGVTAPLPPGMAPWATPVSPSALVSRSGRVSLKIGQAAHVDLRPTPQVRYPLRPEKPGGSVSYGEIVAFKVDRPGTYRVALSSGAWIDIVRNGVGVKSGAHGPGPDCTGLRKMVDFPLRPGRYLLQIAANGAPRITVMIAGPR